MKADDSTRTGSPTSPPASGGTDARAPVAYPPRDRDRYEIVSEHGRGGLGRVMRVFDRELHRFVAVKELISRGHLSEVRFLREALITARLEHPGIVPIHEAGRWPDGTPFYAMKLVAGRPLRDLIAERHTVDERIGLLHHVIAVADAIAYAHDCQIIHRDLKPGNVIVGDFGETIVIDWGLAKDLSVQGNETASGGPFRGEPISGDLTSTGSILGTPAYMAPEQERGEHVDQRADVFAIGAMLWELCALHKVPPANVRQRHAILRGSHIDRDLITILDKSLAPDPARRYANAGALAADLKAFKAGARISARTYSLPALIAHWTRRHRRLAIASVMAVALVIAASVFYVRNISAERDRTRQALVAAQTQKTAAELSEINLLLEKDPTRALEKLKTITERTPQYALLMSRALPRAAERVIPLKDPLNVMRLAPDTGEIAIMTMTGELYTTSFATNELKLVAQDASGPLVRGDGEWWYARRPFGATTSVTSTRAGAPVIPTPGILAEDSSHLYYDHHELHALEPNGDFYTINEHGPERIASQLTHVASRGNNRVTCSRDGQLLVTQAHTVVHHAKCAESETEPSVAVSANGHYAALQDPSTLIIDQHTIALSAPLTLAHELAMADSGLLAIADYLGGGAWFVLPEGDHADAPPHRAARPLSAAARGNLVAWGYQDGHAIVIDTQNHQTWSFSGHETPIIFLALDDQRHKLVTASSNEARIWSLATDNLVVANKIPCPPSFIRRTTHPSDVALACVDGGAWLWNPESGAVSELHRHTDFISALAEFHDEVCSASWDGRVICTPMQAPRNTHTKIEGAGRISRLVACPQGACLLAAANDGKLWRLGETPEILFQHSQTPTALEISPDGSRVASGALDGSLVVYDLKDSRVITRQAAYRGEIQAIHWLGSTLWTASRDGIVKRWRVSSHDATSEEIERRPSVVRGGFLLNLDERITVDESAQLEISASEPSRELKLHLSEPILSLYGSEDRRFVVALSRQNATILDRQKRGVAVIPMRGSHFQSGTFLTPDHLVLCTNGGEIFMVDVTKLPFITY